MLTHEEMKRIALSNPKVKTEYDRLNVSDEFKLLDMVLALRQTSGLTQEQVADRMGTKAPAVARLESSLVSGKHSPTLATLRKYVEACGKKLELRVV